MAVASIMLTSALVTGCRVGATAGDRQRSLEAYAQATGIVEGSRGLKGGPIRQVSLATARRSVAFEILFPRRLPAGSRLVQVSLCSPETAGVEKRGSVQLSYSNYLQITEEGRDSELLEWELADHLNSPKAGKSYRGRVWLKFTTARGRVLGRKPSKSYPGGVIHWWEDGVLCTISGLGIPLRELLRVAVSLEPDGKAAEPLYSEKGPPPWRGRQGPVSVAEARKNVSFRILIPTYLPPGVRFVRAGLLNPDTLIARRPGKVRLDYSDKRVFIAEEAHDEKIPMWEMADYVNWLARRPGVHADNNPWLKLEVGGSRAYGHGPSRNALSAVIWWNNGVEYEVYGGTLPLAEVLKIARSMK